MRGSTKYTGSIMKQLIGIAVCAVMGILFKDVKVIATIFAVLTIGGIISVLTSSTAWVIKESRHETNRKEKS